MYIYRQQEKVFLCKYEFYFWCTVVKKEEFFLRYIPVALYQRQFTKINEVSKSVSAAGGGGGEEAATENVLNILNSLQRQQGGVPSLCLNVIGANKI